MSKKILSVVLALVFVLTTFAVSAFAVGGIGYEEEGSTYTQTWALGEPVDNGDGTWTVDVSLTANYCVGAISFVVTNTNPTGAVLTSVAKGAALTYTANIQFNATSGLVAIIPEPATDAENGPDLTSGGVIATLTYTLADGATADIAIENAPKTSTTPGGDLIAVRLSDNNLTTATMIYGQTVASVGETRTLGAVAEPAIVVVSGYEDSVVIDTNKTFGGKYAGAIYGFEGTSFRAVTYLKNQLAAENGTLTFTKSSVFTGTASVYGTGATVTLNNAAGTAVATYVVIIFGDLDGSGVINATDVNALVAHNKGTSTIAAGPVHMAAQVHCTNAGTGRTININDVNAMVAFNKGTGTIDQAALAAKHVTFTAAANYGSSYVMA